LEAAKPEGGGGAHISAFPGLGVDSAQQIIAEVGPQAASFDSAGQLAMALPMPTLV
jgi:hypothetical protein